MSALMSMSFPVPFISSTLHLFPSLLPFSLHLFLTLSQIYSLTQELNTVGFSIVQLLPADRKLFETHFDVVKEELKKKPGEAQTILKENKRRQWKLNELVERGSPQLKRFHTHMIDVAEQVVSCTSEEYQAIGPALLQSLPEEEDNSDSAEEAWKKAEKAKSELFFYHFLLHLLT